MLKVSQVITEAVTHNKKGVQAMAFPDATSREQMLVKVWADAAGRQEG